MQPKIKNKIFKYNAIFKTIRGKQDNFIIDSDKTVEELLNKYINEYYGPIKRRLISIFNASKIERNERRTIQDFFKADKNPQITVNDF